MKIRRTLVVMGFLLVCTRAPAQGVPVNVLRIEPIGEGEGKALALEGFHALGSPHVSKDGEWIAFDGYKESIQNITSE